MAGLQDTLAGSETRRHGDTVGLPHAVPDGTRIDSLSGNDQPEPGDVVGYDGSKIVKADSTTDTDIIGVLVNYSTYGASHQVEKVKGDTDATVAVQGTYKAKADDGISGGSYVGAGTTEGQFATGSDFRVVDSYDDGTQNWVEVVL